MSLRIVVYEEGGKVNRACSLDDAYEVSQNHRGVAWVSLVEPSEEELSSVMRRFGLRDPTKQNIDDRPGIYPEYWEETLFLTLSPARYLDGPGTVEIGELAIFLGDGFAVTISRGTGPNLDEALRPDAGDSPHFPKLGSNAILYAIFYRVTDDYASVVAALEDAFTRLEAEVLERSDGTVEKIYEASREVEAFRRATEHLVNVLEGLTDADTQGGDGAGSDVGRRLLGKLLRSMRSHAERIDSKVSGFANRLQNLLSVSLTLVSIQRNEQTRKISAWAAILAVPTIIGGIYGMNFDHMPELGWLLGYPFALLLMAVICLVLYLIFRRVGWL